MTPVARSVVGGDIGALILRIRSSIRRNSIVKSITSLASYDSKGGKSSKPINITIIIIITPKTSLQKPSTFSAYNNKIIREKIW